MYFKIYLKRLTLCFLLMLVTSCTSYNKQSSQLNELAANNPEYTDAHVKQFISSIAKYNKQYSDSYIYDERKDYLKKQTPIATLVTCSDSRVSSESFSESDINRMFIIRDIGNQIETASGSVEYGIRHLHTKTLIIMGHTECGAVASSLSNMDGLSKNLQQELLTLRTSTKYSLDYNIIANIDHQVDRAKKDFADLINQGDLLVLGILYDIHNHFGGGQHKLYITNINGVYDKKTLTSNTWLNAIPEITILDRERL